MTYFSAVGVEATLLHDCHTGIILGLTCEALGQKDGLLSTLWPSLRGTERSDIVVSLHCRKRHQRGFSLGSRSGEHCWSSVRSASAQPQHSRATGTPARPTSLQLASHVPARFGKVRCRAKEAPYQIYQTISNHERAISKGAVQKAIACGRKGESGHCGEAAIQVLFVQCETGSATATEKYAEQRWDNALWFPDGCRGIEGAEGYVELYES